MRAAGRSLTFNASSATLLSAALMSTVLLGTGLAAPDVGQAATSAGQAAPAPPATGFERSNGAHWTSLAEESRFLARVDGDNEHVAVERVGSSVQDRPLRLVRVAAPGSTRVPRNTALFVCSQHGDEPAGREACLTTIRDLAYTEDPDMLRFLRATNVLFLPNANPDGHRANTRENADGVDINRDHIALATPEARAVNQVIREHRPDVVQDLHEYGPRPPYYVKDFLSLWPRNLNTHRAVHAESQRFSERYARPAVERAGFSTGVYGILTDPDTGEPIEQIAGDGQERILRNATGVKHAVSLLAETRTDPLTQEEQRDPALNNRRRVDSHLASLEGTKRMLDERRGRIEAATTLARLRGLANTGPVYLGGADNEPPEPERVLDPAPCGYRLTADQFDRLAGTLETHGVHSRPVSGGGVLVPMRQQARNLVPLLLDERADYHLTAAAPVACH